MLVLIQKFKMKMPVETPHVKGWIDGCRGSMTFGIATVQAASFEWSSNNVNVKTAMFISQKKSYLKALMAGE